jgi:acyl-coenzyme A thioesterase PaaI-like protein
VDLARFFDVEGPVAPARRWAGVRLRSYEAGEVVDEATLPAAVRDEAGMVAPGLLAVLADTTGGLAIVAEAPPDIAGMVTTHLHLELLRSVPPGAGRLRSVARLVNRRGLQALAECAIYCGEGRLATATVGCLLLEPRPARRQDAHDGPAARLSENDLPDGGDRDHPLLLGSPFHTALATAVLTAGPGGVTLTFEPSLGLANSSGGLHGGIGAFVGERALDLALRSAAPAGPGRRSLTELRATFIRPIPVGDHRVEARAGFAHLGRRLAAGRGELLDHLGRVAVLVDGTYVDGGPAASPGT